MSTSKRRSWTAAAIPVLIGGLVAAPAGPVHAAPCAKWVFPEQLELFQADGWNITIPVSGDPRVTAGPARARYSNPNNPDASYSTWITGGLNGSEVNIEIHWNNGSKATYDGQIYADGIATGQSHNWEYREWTFFQPNGDWVVKRKDSWTSNKFVCAQ